MASNTIKTRVTIISDTHGAHLNSIPNSPFKRPLPPADLAIHCGDLTSTGTITQYQKTLDLLEEIDAPVKLVIAGNHDLSLDPDCRTRKQEQTSHEEARRLWTAEGGRAKMAGITFLDEGTHTILLNNGARARVYASPWTPEFCDWAFMYELYQDRFNPPGSSLKDAEDVAVEPVPSFGDAEGAVDIIITHGPPFGSLDETTTGEKVGCPHLLRAVMRARPMVHCFGHIHEGWGEERVRWGKNADGVLETKMSIKEWKDGAWKDGYGKEGLEEVEWDSEEAKERHGVFVDASSEGGRPLTQGGGTLFVNASIMNVRYRPVNAPWIVDLDLPATKASR